MMEKGIWLMEMFRLGWSQEVTLSVKRRSVDLDGDSETWEVDWLGWYAYASGRMEKDGSERCSCAVATLTG